MLPLGSNGLRSRTGIRRVLIYRLGSLGDTVVALPSLHLIAKAFPDAERRMLTNFPVNSKAPAAAAVLENTNLVQGYFRYAVSTRNPVILLQLWWTLVRWRPQVLVYLGPVRGIPVARRDRIFFRLCGIPWQIGVPLTLAMQKHFVNRTTGDLEPEAERLARNIAELGDANVQSPGAWDLGLVDSETAKALEILAPVADRPILAVSVGTKVQAKDWGSENWRSLLERLGALLPAYALVLTGVAEEREASQFAAEGWTSFQNGSHVINLCGSLTPRESAAIYRQAKLFIGHDSGPMHLAAALGTPCVAIFAARNIPRVWFPYGHNHSVIYHGVDCMGCGLETCIVQRKKCLTGISVEEVVRAVQSALQRLPPVLDP